MILSSKGRVLDFTAGGAGTLDSVPTDGSTNGIDSNAVYDALELKANRAELIPTVSLSTIADTDDILVVSNGVRYKLLVSVLREYIGGSIVPSNAVLYNGETVMYNGEIVVY